MSENWPSKEQEIWFQAGVTGERQRIIKLLEDNAMIPSRPGATFVGNSHWFERGFNYAVALIKGETND